MNNNNYFMETTTCLSNPMLPSFKDYDVQQQKELERFYDVQRQAAFQQQLAIQQMAMQREQYEEYQRKLAHIHTNAISFPSSPPKSISSNSVEIQRNDQTGKAQKRAEHNAIERARRESLNSKFQQLAHTLPNLQDDRRPSKGTIIERTLEYVKETVEKEETFQQEIDHLREANRTLFLQMAESDYEEEEPLSCPEDDGFSSSSSERSLQKTTSPMTDISSPPDLNMFYNSNNYKTNDFELSPSSLQDNSYMTPYTTHVMLDENQFYF
ncbi:hypothetical protein K501DRAFT_333311 [Backusella circina FSU 941]|nr:hypothetical protein K501DRAFT_333311 [Backusella circina FSU 941]